MTPATLDAPDGATELAEPSTRPSRTAKKEKVDAVLKAAVDVARSAAEEVAHKGDVGKHLGAVMVEERLMAHRFESLQNGYNGWFWNVTIARAPRAKFATVCEVEMLPGDGALLAPAWVPWAERLQPGDLGATDVLPYDKFDSRLEQGFEATGDQDVDRMAIFELGLGRARVLSREGRIEAADRWYSGDHGPKQGAVGNIAADSTATGRSQCSTCGFLLLLAGAERTVFGVCANEWSPDDGRVVSMDHGCGAHSETDVPQRESEWPEPSVVFDDERYEMAANEVAANEVASDAIEVLADEASSEETQTDAVPTDEADLPSADSVDPAEAPGSDD